MCTDLSQKVVLSEKPPITSTIQSLPTALLDTLLGELSTLASVYHKPPETFLGQGRFGAEAMQKAAIEYAAPMICYLVSNRSPGSKSNLPARTPSRLLLRPLQQALQAHKTMWRISSTSISTVLFLPLYKASNPVDRPVWKILWEIAHQLL